MVEPNIYISIDISTDMDLTHHWVIKERKMNKINISFVTCTLSLLFFS